MFIFTVLALIGNFLTMIISINSSFFSRNLNMGIIPITFFAEVPMLMLVCISAAFFAGVKRLNSPENLLLIQN